MQEKVFTSAEAGNAETAIIKEPYNRKESLDIQFPHESRRARIPYSVSPH